eukprot:m.421380 g.421380  ORF g.421380 m.421380 type:complete len:120 (-) comp33904_c0_seq1:215-574(-)
MVQATTLFSFRMAIGAALQTTSKATPSATARTVMAVTHRSRHDSRARKDEGQSRSLSSDATAELGRGLDRVTTVQSPFRAFTRGRDFGHRTDFPSDHLDSKKNAARNSASTLVNSATNL